MVYLKVFLSRVVAVVRRLVKLEQKVEVPEFSYLQLCSIFAVNHTGSTRCSRLALAKPPFDPNIE